MQAMALDRDVMLARGMDSYLLARALLGAGTAGGAWLNGRELPGPAVWPSGAPLGGFASLALALRTDMEGWNLPLFITDISARALGLETREGAEPVPVRRCLPEGMARKGATGGSVTMGGFLALGPRERVGYESLSGGEGTIERLYNVCDTSLGGDHPGILSRLMALYGPERPRRPVPPGLVPCLEDMVGRLVVPLRLSGSFDAYVSARGDAAYYPAVSCAVPGHGPLQSILHAALGAVVRRMRLHGRPPGTGRDGEECPWAVGHDALVAEVATAVMLLGNGHAARLSACNSGMVPLWVEALEEDPFLVARLERDVGLAVTLLKEALGGAGLDRALERHGGELHSGGTPSAPGDMTCGETLVLKDAIARGGIEAALDGLPMDAAEKGAFMSRFFLDGPGLAADGPADDGTMGPWREASRAERLEEAILRMLPRTRDARLSRIVSPFLASRLAARSGDFLVVWDRQSGIADVVLSRGARTGGRVELPGGPAIPFRFSPEEVMSEEEIARKGATIVRNGPRGCPRDGIERALEGEGAAKVRFFSRDGILAYDPDDGHYAGKDVYLARYGGMLGRVSRRETFDLSRAVSAAEGTGVEAVALVPDGNGSHALFVRPRGGEDAWFRPSPGDIARLASLPEGDGMASRGAVLDAVGRECLLRAAGDPSSRLDLGGVVDMGADMGRIGRVRIFREPAGVGKRPGPLLCTADIDGRTEGPRPVSPLQAGLIWLSRDPMEARRHVAAAIFPDILGRDGAGGPGTVAALLQEAVSGGIPEGGAVMFEFGDRMEMYGPHAVLAARLSGHPYTLVTAPAYGGDGGMEVLAFPRSVAGQVVDALARAGCGVTVSRLPDGLRRKVDSYWAQAGGDPWPDGRKPEAGPPAGSPGEGAAPFLALAGGDVHGRGDRPGPPMAGSVRATVRGWLGRLFGMPGGKRGKTEKPDD